MSETPQKNSVLIDIAESPEELLGPPKIDLVGLLLMMLVALVVGFITSVSVLITAFFSVGNFSLQSGVSPILLAMITFFGLIMANYIYIWAAGAIFPHIYTRTRTIFLQVTVFSVILYITLAPAYIFVSSYALTASSVLIVYLIHILLNVFWLELVLAILSQYRYLLLSFYANIVALVVTGMIIFWIYLSSTSSAAALFVLMGLSILGFTVSIGCIFFVKYVYYRIYTTSGYDPLGSIFGRIEDEERALQKATEDALLRK